MLWDFIYTVLSDNVVVDDGSQLRNGFQNHKRSMIANIIVQKHNITIHHVLEKGTMNLEDTLTGNLTSITKS